MIRLSDVKVLLPYRWRQTAADGTSLRAAAWLDGGEPALRRKRPNDPAVAVALANGRQRVPPVSLTNEAPPQTDETC